MANGKILKKNIFENIWIQPAAGDAGGSLGAALAYWHQQLNQERKVDTKDSMKGSYLGPRFENSFIEKELISLKANFKKYSEEDLINILASELIW